MKNTPLHGIRNMALLATILWILLYLAVGFKFFLLLATIAFLATLITGVIGGIES